MKRSLARNIAALALVSAIALTSASGLALAAGGFDGSYVGPRKETNNDNGGACRNINRDSVVIKVSGGVAKYEWGVPVEAKIEADGTFESRTPGLLFHGRQNLVTFKGVIKGNSLEADVGTSACAAHLSLIKKK